MLRRCFALALILFSLNAWSAGEVALPTLSGHVVDQTATLSPDVKNAFETRLSTLEKDQGTQIVILILPTTQPESIEQFGIRLADAWKIGRKGVDDGIIVIVAKDDRHMRIEVGYGLEGAVPDALAKRIVAEQMAPRFREGDFAGGLTASLDSLEKLVRGEALPPPVSQAQDQSQDGENLFTLLCIVILAAGTIRSIFGLPGSLAVSGLAGWLAWGLFTSLGIAGLAAIVAFVFSFVRLGNGGWYSGGGSGGFGRGGGGGFSGGGGGFGGGGASGNW